MRRTLRSTPQLLQYALFFVYGGKGAVFKQENPVGLSEAAAVIYDVAGSAASAVPENINHIRLLYNDIVSFQGGFSAVKVIFRQYLRQGDIVG